jgi:phenylalanyl-tRNA synthetase beta chain
VHPLVARGWDIEGPISAFEVDLGLTIEQMPEEIHYRDVTTFPAVRRDISVRAPSAVAAAEVVRVVRAAGGSLLVSARVVDVYEREADRSLTVRLEFRASDRTLTDEEVRPAIEKIGKRLASELQAEIPNA